MKRSDPPKYGKPDAENPEWTKDDFARARPLRDFPEMHSAIKRSLRGRPAGSAQKSPVTISLDKDILAKLRASGAGWQTRLNDMVRSAIGLMEK